MDPAALFLLYYSLYFTMQQPENGTQKGKSKIEKQRNKEIQKYKNRKMQKCKVEK